jgi:hypothetical protein
VCVGVCVGVSRCGCVCEGGTTCLLSETYQNFTFQVPVTVFVIRSLMRLRKHMLANNTLLHLLTQH